MINDNFCPSKLQFLNDFPFSVLKKFILMLYTIDSTALDYEDLVNKAHYTVSRKGGPLLVLGGYHFTKKSNCKLSTYWVCHQRVGSG